ncbi:hypothetical protein [Chromobacterium violaceum]|uniref:hypothetical protein n=1 Tax=Chromobacterium violaceum TaxID=536 RepID=UPI00111BF967|nr:hypothetical protein [Chromobacterium violaceum]
MIPSAQQHQAAAKILCETAIPLLQKAGQRTVADSLAQILQGFSVNNLQAAAQLCKLLPRYDIADFWQSMDWMEENPSPETTRAFLAALYSQTLIALGNWRVCFEFGASRPVVETSHDAIAFLAAELIQKKKSQRTDT